MPIASRFAVAVHMLILADECARRDIPCTSTLMASSVNTNPVVIRRITGSLKAAGLMSVRAGPGGASVSRPLESITLLEVYKAVGAVEEAGLFALHRQPNPACVVGSHVNAALTEALSGVQEAMEAALDKKSVRDVLDGIIAQVKGA